MDDEPIPNYVDRPIQFFFWEIDEVAPLIFMMGVGIMTDTLTYVMIPALICAWRFSRFKLTNLDGMLMHLSYSIGLLNLNKRFWYGMIREMEE